MGIGSPRVLLDAVAPLPVRPMRVLVAGTSGAGKTTAARRVAARLDIRILRQTRSSNQISRSAHYARIERT